MDKEIVRFGLKNAHYAPWDATEKKFGTPVPIPGAVSMSISPEGSSTTFYADDKAYYTVSSNGGYTGTLEIAAIPDQMLIDVLGYIKDANGMILEDSDAVPSTFALLYEVASNEEPCRFAFYNCTLSRPSGDSNTKSDSIEVDTQSLEFTAIARTLAYGDGEKPFVKGHLPKTAETATAYESFFDAVLLPKAAA